ncbi:unnamed protein product [Parajaminaea phylloscopi]
MLVLIVGDLHLPLRAANLPLKFRKLLVPGKIQQVICTGNVCDRETWDYLRTVAPDVKGVKGDFDESPHLPQALVIQHGPLRLGVVHGHQILPLGDRDLLGSLAMQMDVDVLLTGATHKYESWEDDGRFFVNPGSATGAWAVDWPLFEQEEPEGSQTSKGAGDEPEGERDEGQLKDAAGETQAKASDTQSALPDGETTEKQSETPEGDGDALESAVTDPKEASGAKSASDQASTDETPTDSKTRPPPQSSAKTSRPKRKAAPPPTPSFVLLDIQGTTIVSYVYQLIGGEVKVEKSEYKKDLDAAREGSHSGGGTGGTGDADTSSGGAAAMAASSIAASIESPAW